MIENTVIAKIIGGVTVASAGGGTVAYYRNEIVEIWNAKNVSFIVKAKIEQTNFLNSNRCFSSSDNSAKENAYCELRKYDTKDNNKKFINLKTINNNTKWHAIKKQETITANSFYKLTVDVARFNKEIVHDTTGIFIKSTSDNKFAEFTIIATLDEKTPKANNTYILASSTIAASEDETITESNKNCKLFENTEKKLNVKFMK